ncbi:MAG: hypothetical protein GY938_07730 [Ketobacter sp.]|nr:hypothetical protein [Ketobacter sp.]
MLPSSWQAPSLSWKNPMEQTMHFVLSKGSQKAQPLATVFSEQAEQAP